MKKIALIGAASSAGARNTGQELTPTLLRQQGICERLIPLGFDVVDLGDTPLVAFIPDSQHPKAQNLNLVASVAKEVARKISTAAGLNAMPLVLGGDCTITLGVLAGLLPYNDSLGLLYFDADVDLNTPETTHTGILDGMVLAHIVGRGAPELSRLGSRYPLVQESNIVLFGFNTQSGWIDPDEMRVLESSRMIKYPADKVRGKIKQQADEALSCIEDKVKHFLLHFDVDVIKSTDLPVADVPHEFGLSIDEAMQALTIFVTSPRCAGLVITEFNACRVGARKYARQLIDELISVFHHIPR